MTLTAWPGMALGGRFFATLVLCVYTFAGNAWFGGWLLGKLESPYVSMTHPAEPFDTICELGGGSSATPGGDAQLGPSGDRLIVPAKLFLSGKARHLVASGLSVTDIDGSRSIAHDTATLWIALGIPDAAISRLSTPRTTSEEIRAYKELVAANSWKRVGVCSSAWSNDLALLETLTSSTPPTTALPGEIHHSPAAKELYQKLGCVSRSSSGVQVSCPAFVRMFLSARSIFCRPSRKWPAQKSD